MPVRSASPADLEIDQVDRLHKSLRIAGMTSGQMAEYLGVHRNTVSNYLGGKSVDKRTLMLWALRTGVPYEWLQSGKVAPDGGDDGQSIGQPFGNANEPRRLAAVA